MVRKIEVLFHCYLWPNLACGRTSLGVWREVKGEATSVQSIILIGQDGMV